MEQMADQITARLLADTRSYHEELESILTLPAEAQAAAVAMCSISTGNYSVSEEQLWDLTTTELCYSCTH